MGNEQSSQTMEDPYEVLGVERTATTSEINAAFTQKAKRYHRSGEASTPASNLMYQRVVAAYKAIEKKADREVLNEAIAATHKQLTKKHHCEPATEEETRDFAERIREAEPTGMGVSDGYGNDYQRMSAKDLVGGSRRDDVSTPNNVFGGGAYDRDMFNKAFEQERVKVHGGLIEKTNVEDIVGFAGDGAGQFSQIATYNNFIVDAEQEDFGRTNQYTDYRVAYGGGTSNPGSIDREKISRANLLCEDKTELSQSGANDRLRDYKSNVFDLGIERGQRDARKNDAESVFVRQKETELQLQRERNRRTVEKYASQQYNTNLPIPDAR